MSLALVTGAHSGLGKVLCQSLAEQGVRLIVSARTIDQLQELSQTLPPETILHPADLADPAARRGLIALIRQLTPDLLINNAGFGLYGDALDHPIEKQLEMLRVNAEAVIELTLECARALKDKKKEGTVLNVSSCAAFFTYPSFALYAATKALVHQFSESLDTEMRPYGICILSALPGQFDSPFRIKAGGKKARSRLFVMSTNRVASAVLRQIRQKKRVAIIDFRYRILLFLSRFIPRRILEKILRAGIIHK